MLKSSQVLSEGEESIAEDSDQYDNDVAINISNKNINNNHQELKQNGNLLTSQERKEIIEKMKKDKSSRKGSLVVSTRERLESTSLLKTPVVDDDFVDYHQHRLQNGEDPFDLKYRLYAVVVSISIFYYLFLRNMYEFPNLEHI